ncbi:ABC transporter ATP-binding protein [Actinocorallia sp. B10E7]|uniref:ABC transporter ATP-binding protein n=1 Tax=Actinocorallia sp. B10E7 TaxID=3153558 RepID=UPI00325F2470
MSERAPAPARPSGKGDLLRLAWRADRVSTVMVAATMAIGGIGPALFMILTGAAIGRIPEAVEMEFADGARKVLGPVAAAGAVFLVTQVAGKIRFTVAEVLGQRAEIVLRERALRACAIDQGTDHLRDEKTRDDLALVSGVAGGLPLERAFAGFAEVATALLAAVGPVVLLMFFQVWAGVLVAAAWIGVRAVAGKENARRLELLFGQAAALRRADYFRRLAVDGRAAKEIRVFGLAPWVLGRLDDEWRAAISPTWRSRRGGDVKVALLTGLLVVIYAVVFGALVNAASRGDLEVGAFAVFLQALIGASAISGGTAQYGLDVALAPVAAVRRLEERKAEHAVPPPPATAGGMPRGALELRELRFAYDGGRPVLDGVSVRMEMGDSVALVGANGAGKSTLLKQIAGLLDPDSGQVLVDGVPLTELDRRQWRAQLAMVFQDFVRLPLTVAENVHVFRADPVDEATRRTVMECLERVGLAKKIASLPQGMDTLLGRDLPGGAELSGGQWQRLALARAFFTISAGARVLLVDEPTANIDPAGEAEFFDGLLAETEGLLRIVVSHRFSTVRRVGRILVIEGGRVIEDGSHDELMRAGGRYREMFLAQASAFVAAPGEAGA